MAPVELLIAGGGSRGATFAGWAARHPERVRVVAVAEPRADRREALADAHGVHPDRRFADWREALADGRIADAAVVATLDREHTEPAIAVAEQGTWWSTTSLSHAHTQRPLGALAQRALDPLGRRRPGDDVGSSRSPARAAPRPA